MWCVFVILILLFTWLVMNCVYYSLSNSAAYYENSTEMLTNGSIVDYDHNYHISRDRRGAVIEKPRAGTTVVLDKFALTERDNLSEITSQ